MIMKSFDPLSSNSKDVMDGFINAQQLSSRLKIPYSKINYYTSLGFFEITRKEGNKRYYSMTEVTRRYELVSKLINEGYPLALIRKKFSKVNGHELL